MVAVAAIFIHYQLTPTRRSRGQVIDVQWLNPLRIRRARQPHTFLRLRQLLIRTTYIYTYTYSALITTLITADVYRCYPPYLPSCHLHLPVYCLGYTYTCRTLSTSMTSGVKPELRCSVEAKPLYTYIYTNTTYVQVPLWNSGVKQELRCYVAVVRLIYVYLPLRLSVVVPSVGVWLRGLRPLQTSRSASLLLGLWVYLCISICIYIRIRNTYKYMYKFFYFDYKQILILISTNFLRREISTK